MKKITFDLVFKIIVLLLLSIILIVCSNKSEPISNNYEEQESSQVGRYKEIKTKTNRYGREYEEVLILDTKTGQVSSPN